jgi:hypothetical protein
LRLLHLSGLVVHHLYTIGHTSCELDELLMSRVLVHIVVSVFGILELYHEAMRMRTLRER